jgi:hypothetical protein
LVVVCAVSRDAAADRDATEVEIVIQFDWNTLQPGDQVVVHEHAPESYLVAAPGKVEFVSVRKRGNEVGIRLAASSGSRVVWPTRYEVHAPTDAEVALCVLCLPAAATSSPAVPVARAAVA